MEVPAPLPFPRPGQAYPQDPGPKPGTKVPTSKEGVGGFLHGMGGRLDQRSGWGMASLLSAVPQDSQAANSEGRRPGKPALLGEGPFVLGSWQGALGHAHTGDYGLVKAQ